MVEITITYNGELRSTASHGPSGTVLVADAPVDNHGKGESFSPTDLLATALGTCMLTYVGITGKAHGWPVEGTRLIVKKEMIADPLRRVNRLVVDIYLPPGFKEEHIAVITNAVITCPVKLSISERIHVPITFH